MEVYTKRGRYDRIIVLTIPYTSDTKKRENGRKNKRGL